MRVKSLINSQAVALYPTVSGLVFVAECDAGHSMLCCPQPDDYTPIISNHISVTTLGTTIVRMPLIMTNLHVRRAYRGQGIGGKLVEACKTFASRRNVPIVLRALPYGRSKPMSLKELIEFYENCGFRSMGQHGGNSYMAWEP